MGIARTNICASSGGSGQHKVLYDAFHPVNNKGVYDGLGEFKPLGNLCYMNYSAIVGTGGTLYAAYNGTQAVTPVRLYKQGSIAAAPYVDADIVVSDGGFDASPYNSLFIMYGYSPLNKSFTSRCYFKLDDDPAPVEAHVPYDWDGWTMIDEVTPDTYFPSATAKLSAFEVDISGYSGIVTPCFGLFRGDEVNNTVTPQFGVYLMIAM